VEVAREWRRVWWWSGEWNRWKVALVRRGVGGRVVSVRKVSRSRGRCRRFLRRSEFGWSVGKFDIDFDASGRSRAS
jgi:hypothetical protein